MDYLPLDHLGSTPTRSYCQIIIKNMSHSNPPQELQNSQCFKEIIQVKCKLNYKISPPSSSALTSQYVVVWLFSHVQLFVTPWTAACKASLSFTISRGMLKLMSTESVMPSNHLLLCHPLLLLPSIFPSIRVFSNGLALFIRWPKLELQLQYQSL